MSLIDKFNEFKYNKTDFESGGLLEEDLLKSKRSILSVPSKFVAPRKIDSRDMCLSSSNQYKTPHCAGYTTAGYIEYNNWKSLHYPAQVDGDSIYAEAKKIDRNNRPGTTLRSAAKAAIRLNLINGTPKYVDYPSVNASGLSKIDKRILSIKFALHEFGVVLSGFKITNEWNYVNKKTGMIRDFSSGVVSRGGHAVLLCGYDNRGVYIQNSWGEAWGHHGFAILSWEKYVRQIMRAMVIVQK